MRGVFVWPLTRVRLACFRTASAYAPLPATLEANAVTAQTGSLQVVYPASYRLLLCVGGLAFGPLFLVIGIGSVVLFERSQWASSALLLIIVGGLGAFFVWGAIDALRARLTLEPDAITKRGWIGTPTSIPWREVDSVTWSHWAGYVLRSRRGERISFQKPMATGPVLAALRAGLDAAQTRGFPTADLSPPTRSEPPRQFYWALTAALLAMFASQLDWRNLDMRCLSESAQKMLSRRRGGEDRPSLCLHWAAYDGDVPWLNSLLARGADPNAEDNAGNSALTFAVMGGYVDVTKRLLAAGADPFAASGVVDAPIDIALARDERAIVEAMVLSRMSEIDTTRATALLVSARQQGRRDTEEFLRRELKDKLPAIADPEVEKRYRETLARASAALDRRDWPAGIGLAEEAITLDPVSGPAYGIAAYGYLRLGNFGRAKERARLATERMPTNGSSWQLLGSIHLQTGDYLESDSALSKALSLAVPDAGSALGDRALARSELGRFAEALADARAACAKNSELGCGMVRDLEARLAPGH